MKFVTKIVAISDLHGTLPDIPECDLLLVGGDICPVMNHDRQYQTVWLRDEFNYWIRSQPATNVVWVAGNHDFVLQDAGRKLHDQLLGIYLENSWVEVNGLKIWGSPLSNRFGGWAFMKEEDQLRDVWKTIPRDIDILITHGPPYGYGDGIPAVSWSAEKRGWNNLDSAEHVGSTSLTNQLIYEEWPNLKLHITGHIHEAYGSYKIGNVDVYNVSIMDGSYNPTNQPVEITL